MVENKALDEMQSAYRQHNLKETALMKVQQNTQHWRSATLVRLDTTTKLQQVVENVTNPTTA